MVDGGSLNQVSEVDMTVECGMRTSWCTASTVQGREREDSEGVWDTADRESQVKERKIKLILIVIIPRQLNWKY